MIHILHGENVSAIRDCIVSLKVKLSAHLTEFKASEISMTEAVTRYYSRGLFGEKVILAIDVLKDKSLDFPALLQSVQKESENHLVLWQGEPLSKTHPLAKVSQRGVLTKEFPAEVKASIFAFTDALFERRKKDAYKELRLLLEKGEDEFGIFSMIVAGLRNIAYAVFGSAALDRLHPFVKQKSTALSKKYSEREVTNLYSFLYNQDLALKTGKATPDVILPLIIERVAEGHFA